MANGLNRCEIIGNLGNDPDLRFLANGDAVCTMSVAVNRSYRVGDGDERREEVTWFRVIAWRQLAEVCGNYLQKGRRVFVEGRIQTRSYQAQDGQTKYTWEIVATQVLFLDANSNGNGNADDIDPSTLPFE